MGAGLPVISVLIYLFFLGGGGGVAVFPLNQNSVEVKIMARGVNMKLIKLVCFKITSITVL